MLNTYVNFNKCNCNLYDIKQLINILNMDNVEDTIEYTKKDIFNAITRMKLRVTLHRVSCSYINVVTIIRGLT